MAKGTRRLADPRNTARIVGANIRHLRKQRFPGWGGQRRFAEFLNISPNDLSVYEKGRAVPNEFRLAEMALRLELKPDDLKRPLPGVLVAPDGAVDDPPLPPANGDDPEAADWRDRALELEETVLRLEGRLEAYAEQAKRHEEKIRTLQEANFILRHLLYVDASPEAKARREAVLKKLDPAIGELVRFKDAF